MKIRSANKRDTRELVSLHTELSDYLRRYSKVYKSGENTSQAFYKFLRNNLKNPKVKILVAEYHRKVIGFYIGEIETVTALYVTKQMGFLHDGYLLAEYRGMKIGKKLFETLMNWFREHRIKYVEVVVDKNNRIGVDAWKKFGFIESQKVMRIKI
ncbi:MAG: GNAT family N-acetyltransferase [Candidatus ainarchaeum sp.]|nr:GNAT family N-acetyltransferase [Candidatus ainarchaeum sp.]